MSRQGIFQPPCFYVVGNSQYVMPRLLSNAPAVVVGGEVPVEEDIITTEEILPDFSEQDKILQSIEARVVKLSGRGLSVL